MFGLPTDFLLDGLVAILLVATIFYSALLDRRLKALRSGQDGLRHTIDQLNTATARAEVSIGQLKQASGEVDSGLSEQVRRARSVADELSVMVTSGNKLADRLSGEIPGSSSGPRKVVPLATRAEPSAAPAKTARPEPRAESRPAQRSTASDGASSLETGLNKTLLEALKKAR
ncbi:MAG: DUF6468 domain-containing protein [Parvibaculaceae bacterium]